MSLTPSRKPASSSGQRRYCCTFLHDFRFTTTQDVFFSPHWNVKGCHVIPSRRSVGTGGGSGRCSHSDASSTHTYPGRVGAAEGSPTARTHPSTPRYTCQCYLHLLICLRGRIQQQFDLHRGSFVPRVQTSISAGFSQFTTFCLLSTGHTVHCFRTS